MQNSCDFEYYAYACVHHNKQNSINKLPIYSHNITHPAFF
ncbi:hypothetical protein CRYPA_1950 [uncultured Candidatus Thioglobus sp.]|nr:hypothetical protein CRYPA_1950 [uncultured Candidatus Thioglobus sp.]